MSFLMLVSFFHDFASQGETWSNHESITILVTSSQNASLSDMLSALLFSHCKSHDKMSNLSSSCLNNKSEENQHFGIQRHADSIGEQS